MQLLENRQVLRRAREMDTLEERIVLREGGGRHPTEREAYLTMHSSSTL